MKTRSLGCADGVIGGFAGIERPACDIMVMVVDSCGMRFSIAASRSFASVKTEGTLKEARHMTRCEVVHLPLLIHSCGIHLAHLRWQTLCELLRDHDDSSE